jgi:hypothetical protein
MNCNEENRRYLFSNAFHCLTSGVTSGFAHPLPPGD